MAQGAARVPKFGDWGNEQAVPYTMYFDKARKDRTTGTSGGRMINPNDPEENPEMFASNNTPSSRPDQEPRRVAAVRQTAVPRKHNDEDVDNGNKRFFESPARNVDNRRHGQQVIPSRIENRSSGGSEHRPSPLHQQVGVKSSLNGRGSAVSPAAWEAGKNPLYHDFNNASSKSRMGNGSRKEVENNRNQQRAGGAAVPRFGEWAEQDPSTAENFTQIFNKVREERKYPTTDRPININYKQPAAGYGTPTTQTYNKNDKHTFCGCFGM